MLYFKLNTSSFYRRIFFRVLSWITIYSISLFSLSGIQQERVFSDSNHSSDVVISFSLQNSVEQNINERDLRQKNSVNINFSIDPILCSFTTKIKLSDSYQIVSYVKSFGAILVSSSNNHSLRSPLVNSI